MLLTRRLVLALIALGPTACQAILPTGPSNVAQGRYYGTGDPEYDDFFLRVFRLQLALKDAPKRLGEPRQKVADSLNVGADPDEIRVALTKRAGELSNRGIRYTVAIPDAADKPPSLIVTGNPTGKDFELKGHIEAALKSAGELKIDLTAWLKELDELSSKESALETKVGEAFASHSESQRAEITQNLSDGQKIITLLVERTRDLDHATSDFLKALGTALGEKQLEPVASESVSSSSSSSSSSSDSEKKSKKGAGKAAKPATPEPKPAPTKQKGGVQKPAPASKPAPAPAPKAPAPKAPAAAPKPAKSETGDAPPPPKPTQGTAKPDFEP